MKASEYSAVETLRDGGRLPRSLSPSNTVLRLPA